MDDYATATTHFATRTGLALEATFDGGRLTSDGGLPWLAAIDREVGGCEVIAAHVPEWRGKRVQHSLLELVRQRVYQIACGDADHNDADTLRSDPVLKLVCGRRPERGADLASQPTRARLEHAVSARACYRMRHALGALSITQRAKHGVPQRIVLDSDSTDDPTHGDQEGSS